MLVCCKKAKQSNSRLWLQREGHTRLQLVFYWLFEWNIYFFVFLFQKFTVHVLKNHILAGRLPLNNLTGDMTVTTLAGTKLLIRKLPNVSEVKLKPPSPSLVVFEGHFKPSFLIVKNICSELTWHWSKNGLMLGGSWDSYRNFPWASIPYLFQLMH